MEPLHNGLDQIPLQLPSTDCWRFPLQPECWLCCQYLTFTAWGRNLQNSAKFCGQSFFYVMALKVYISQAGNCRWRLFLLSCFKMWVTILCHWKSFVLFISTKMHNIYFYLKSLYIIITPTCFDTFVSTARTSKVVLRWSYVVSILLKFH